MITGQGANIDLTPPPASCVIGIFAALAEFERELIRERTMAGLKPRARGKKGGRKFHLTKGQVRLAQSSMKNKETNVSELCEGTWRIPPVSYRYVGPDGELRMENEVLEI